MQTAVVHGQKKLVNYCLKKTKPDYSLSANLIIIALLPFFLSAKIIIHLLRYLPNDNTLHSNLRISRLPVCHK